MFLLRPSDLCRVSCALCQHVALTSVFLAMKAEETPCKLLDLLRAFDRALHRRFSPPSPSSSSSASPYPSLYYRSSLFHHWRSILASLELIILSALGYSLYLLHPHRVLPHLLNVLIPRPSHPLLPSLLTSSIALLNSAHLTPLPIQHPPLTLALAAIGLSLHRHHLGGFGLGWVDLFGVGGDEVRRAAEGIVEAAGEGVGRRYVRVGGLGAEGEEEDEIDERRREGEELWEEVRQREEEEKRKAKTAEEEERLMREITRIAMQESLRSLRPA